MNPAPQHGTALRQTVGWCGLLLYVFAASSLGPAFTAVLGAFDSTHHVQFGSRNGVVQVILHHDSGCTQHRHEGMARALTLLAGPAGPADPDHMLQFPTEASRKPITKVERPLRDGTVDGPFACIGTVLCRLDEVAPFPTPPRPLPDAGGNLRCLRSILLLI